MKTLSDLEIAARVRAGKNFTVNSTRERQKVYAAARFAGVTVKIEPNDKGAYDVKFFVPA